MGERLVRPTPPRGFGLREPFFLATPEEEQYVDDLILYEVGKEIRRERLVRRLIIVSCLLVVLSMVTL